MKEHPHKRLRRLSEEAQMLLGGLVTVALIFGAILAFSAWGPKDTNPRVFSNTLKLER